jgi:hypothetical protein
MMRMPHAERWSPLRNVLSGPKDPEPVHLPTRLVVRTQDVKIAFAQPVQHVRHRLLGCPCSGRLFLRRGRRFASEACVGPSRTGKIPVWDRAGKTKKKRQRGSHEEMSGDVRDRTFHQLVCQTLGETLDSRFRGIVSGVAAEKQRAKKKMGITLNFNRPNRA